MAVIPLMKSTIGIMVSIVAMVMVLYCAGAFSGNAGDPAKGGGREASEAVLAFVDRMIMSAPTNGLSGYPHSKMSNLAAQMHSSGRKVANMALAIENGKERLGTMSNIVEKLLLSIKIQKDPFEELNCFLETSETLDALSMVIWETVHDPDLVLALWVRQRREYEERKQVCEKGISSSQAKLKDLTTRAYIIQLRLATVRQDELTHEERLAAKECNAGITPLHQLLGRLERLRKYYEEWDVGPIGKRLMNGDLYRRFKQP